MFFPYGFGGQGDWGLLLVLAAALIGLIAQWRVKSVFEKYSHVRAQSGATAENAAQALLRDAGIRDVRIERSPGGALSDHYSPKEKVLRLSSSVEGSGSLAALGVAAHEVGHAMQHAEGYAPLRIRNAIAPAASLISTASMPLFFLGLFLGMTGLAAVGVVCYLAAVVFQLITLPVELNASSRALYALEASGILKREETPYAKKVLSAAASTYLASALMAIAQLLRMAALLNNRRR
ncbi:MAG: zinc metallopeptidase [Christensenellaceae bacterium]|jgi:Zn-dependent membrane protease YugP|nr:zinc metallopeptidase [Christensenellaceae bacterium]